LKPVHTVALKKKKKKFPWGWLGLWWESVRTEIKKKKSDRTFTKGEQRVLWSTKVGGKQSKLRREGPQEPGRRKHMTRGGGELHHWGGLFAGRAVGEVQMLGRSKATGHA